LIFKHFSVLSVSSVVKYYVTIFTNACTKLKPPVRKLYAPSCKEEGLLGGRGQSVYFIV
jgi:hypothetical protein